MSAKKARALSQRERRRLRTQQIIFIAIGVLVILAFVASMIKY